MHDVIRRLQPGHVVSWRDDSGRRGFDYVGYVATNKLLYTTATDLNTSVPQTMTLTEFANYLENIGAALFLATDWQVQDAGQPASAAQLIAPAPAPAKMPVPQPQQGGLFISDEQAARMGLR